eukprot:SAG11_NODE_2981_length_2794_cov_1.858256_2_plen_68_part_00
MSRQLVILAGVEQHLYLFGLTFALIETQMHCQQKMCPHGVDVGFTHGLRHNTQSGLQFVRARHRING